MCVYKNIHIALINQNYSRHKLIRIIGYLRDADRQAKGMGGFNLKDEIQYRIAIHCVISRCQRLRSSRNNCRLDGLRMDQVITFEGRLRLNEDDIYQLNYILEEALVSTVPGVAFGMDDHIRISYASGEKDLRKAADRITKALS